MGARMLGQAEPVRKAPQEPRKQLDCRALVPRTPPEGLREWTLQKYRGELGRHGLVYEAEYVIDSATGASSPRAELNRAQALDVPAARSADYGLEQVLDEWAKPRKIKMVRCRCSACGESILLNWGKDERHGYGFVLPEDVEGDWPHTVTAAGDETFCPICGEGVLVNKAAAIGKGCYVTAECSVMSADLVGESNMLALTGWTVQRRVYRSGSESLAFLPAEAYVFSREAPQGGAFSAKPAAGGPTASSCAQLMGWRNSYSGNAGYFISYTHEWRQPERWHESWGGASEIFGLTPELVEHSCLPNCKLDVYMAGGTREVPQGGTFGPRLAEGEPAGPGRYPVAYLRLYQEHPNVEHVLVNGLPRVLRDLIELEVNHLNWEKNVRGRMNLPEIDWEESRPAQMLRLTKEELRLAKKQDWGLLFWNLFTKAKEHGELLTGEDIENAFRLGDDNVADLVGRGPVARSIRYLLRQSTGRLRRPEALKAPLAALHGQELAEDEDPEQIGIPDVTTLLDYWTMAQALGRNLNDLTVRFPRDLLTAHDQAAELMEYLEGEHFAQQFRIRRRLLRKYSFRANGLLIRPAASQRELTEEGNALHHCVGTYGTRHATGKTAIFFIRRADKPKEPFFTLELDEKNLTVRQNRGLRNCARTPEVEAFEKAWLEWVRNRVKKKVRVTAA